MWLQKAQDGGGSDGKLLLMGIQFWLGMIDKLWRWIVVMVEKHYKCTQ
jgi:hypothetical protein